MVRATALNSRNMLIINKIALFLFSQVIIFFIFIAYNQIIKAIWVLLKTAFKANKIEKRINLFVHCQRSPNGK